MLEKYAERFDCLGKKFIEKLKEYDEGADIELLHPVGLYAIDVICGRYIHGLIDCSNDSIRIIYWLIWI